ncbi:chromate transporter [Mesobacillus maritimus]|uniref:chromate transporter n=1 Tax=Mesobacillus maritimus TaxID=1643336 RepID=UPI00203ADAD0|nr:chromate transporter [Mesobacillus maritimus]MCM3670654.1 chromate transporter [Mesobacillus maritimus]
MNSRLHTIFWSFFKISPVTFGGGFAMIPFITKEIVENRKWLTEEEMADLLALAQTLPGSVAVNTATFIGYRLKGLYGAIVAIMGISLPTFFIMLVLGGLYYFFQSNPLVKGAFRGMGTTIVALMVYSAIKIAKTSIVDKPTFFLLVLSIPILFYIHPLIVLFIGALLGIINWSILRRFGFSQKQAT